MAENSTFAQDILNGYTFKGDVITIGAAMLDGVPIPELFVKIPLKTLNRHGLISGATGTGKTKTLQAIAEGLSENGVSVLMMDIKGDLGGISQPGVKNDKILDRHGKIGIEYTTKKYPVELLSISEEKGVRLRATISEFGPVLFSKMLSLNDVQSGIVSLIFKFCDDEKLPLLDLKDFKKVLQYISNDGKEKIQEIYGNISTTSTSTILRKIIELEQQGAELFFGEKSFDVQDFLRVNKNGLGYISLMKLTDIQDKPKLFSTFMLSMLAEIYATFPEEGDLEKPKLVLFIDEAHLIFEEATKALSDQLITIIKLIRSKGVGIFFCTQNPSDIPPAVLGQLGLKIQHALRAFTANDRKMIRLTADNYPTTKYYQTEELLTNLGIGEAAITVLAENGSPTPLVATLLRAPQSRMGTLNESEVDTLINDSDLREKYNSAVDRESAYEILARKIDSKFENSQQEDEEKPSKAPTFKREKSTLEQVMDSPLTRQIGKTLLTELTRGLLGVLGVKPPSRRR